MIFSNKPTTPWLSTSRLCISLLLITSIDTIAETIESIEYKNYVISPRAAHEIKPELMRHTPIRDYKGSYNGHTDWYIDWQYQTRQEANICRINQLKVKVHVVHILPRLSEYVTDKQTIEVFNRFNAALTQHEKNHGNNGLSAAREIDKALNALQPQRSCHRTSWLIDDIGHSIVKKYVAADKEYDRTTNNGMTEGAVIY